MIYRIKISQKAERLFFLWSCSNEFAYTMHWCLPVPDTSIHYHSSDIGSVSLLVFMKLYAKLQGPFGTAGQTTQRISGISYPENRGLTVFRSCLCIPKWTWRRKAYNFKKLSHENLHFKISQRQSGQ
jgi:hypothetical protein